MAMFILRIIFLVAVLLSCSGFAAPDKNDCTLGKACQPFNVSKPCVQRQRMDLRFGLSRHGGPSLAFGFCPVVDELQAFNLTGVNSLLTGLSASSNVSIFAYGQGLASNPTSTTDFTNAVLFAVVSDSCKATEVAVVNFLILRVPMTRGVYTYRSNVSYPDTAGFAPTCDSHDRCSYVSGSVCIGESGRRNCATCRTEDKLPSAQTTVWTSYYGTDANGKEFLSGGSSPAEFQRFGLGALEAMARVFAAGVATGTIRAIFDYFYFMHYKSKA